MIVANGSVAMDIDLNRLNGVDSDSRQMSSLRFDVAPNSFFTILVFNKDLRGPEPGSMALIPQSSATLPAALNASFNQLVIEKHGVDEAFDLVVRDGKTGFIFFNIEGNLYDYDANGAVAQHQGRKASDFRRVCRAAWASGGSRVGSRKNFDYGNDASDRNHAGG